VVVVVVVVSGREARISKGSKKSDRTKTGRDLQALYSSKKRTRVVDMSDEKEESLREWKPSETGMGDRWAGSK
jgi:hypothetical protein